MIVGHNHHLLEKRITAALLSGIPHPREAYFLQKMSERILHNGKNTRLSDRQAEWLADILIRCEKKPTRTSQRPAPAPRLPNAQLNPKRAEPIQNESCLVDARTRTQHSSKQPDDIVPMTPSSPVQAPEPTAPREPDVGAILRRVIARNENFRQHRERIARQRLRSSSTSVSL
ncbi:hypothetical protein [Bradyrhizobium diversitatis]|uniref:Uncharacterized protein n=1 Tax=Bradyrhizobium diversitatis TaxID=2755406 RepID=A0ABS0NXM0_9BRAD|nr:hypothetical protein [Bradyrhizobium diversitatis]MBH5385734.1 hypothetical protein [Bradyrhizobium diversitatis]